MAKVKVQTQARAKRIAESVPLKGAFAGFDFLTLTMLLQELIPLIISCFQPDDGPDVQKHVQENHNPKQKECCGYDKRMAYNAARAARRAARRRGVRLTWSQGLALGYATLDDIRLEADPGSISQVIREHDGDPVTPDAEDEIDWTM